MDIYREQIIDHYKHPRNFGHLVKPTAKSHVANTVCGDKLDIEVQTEIVKGKKVIKEIVFSGTGCAISIASASMLMEYLKGKPVTVLASLTPKILTLLNVELSASRMKCGLLSLEAVKELKIHLEKQK